MVSPINNLNALFASFSQFEVGKPARVTPTTPSIVQEAVEGLQNDLSKSGRSPNFQALLERESRFGDLTRPKASLAPSDELALFAENAQATVSTAPVEEYPVGLREGSEVSAEAQTYNFQLSRKPSYVAQLYAQMNDITFSNDTLYKQAA